MITLQFWNSFFWNDDYDRPVHIKDLVFFSGLPIKDCWFEVLDIVLKHWSKMKIYGIYLLVFAAEFAYGDQERKLLLEDETRVDIEEQGGNIHLIDSWYCLGNMLVVTATFSHSKPKKEPFWKLAGFYKPFSTNQDLEIIDVFYKSYRESFNGLKSQNIQNY